MHALLFLKNASGIFQLPIYLASPEAASWHRAPPQEACSWLKGGTTAGSYLGRLQKGLPLDYMPFHAIKVLTEPPAGKGGKP